MSSVEFSTQHAFSAAFSQLFYKGDSLHDFMFAFLHHFTFLEVVYTVLE